MVAGRSCLVIACLTAVREVPGSTHAVCSCVYRKSHCDLQPWARAVRNFPAVPSSVILVKLTITITITKKIKITITITKNA